MEETPKPLSDVVRTMHAFRFEAGVPGPAKDAPCRAPPGVAAAASAAAADPAYAASLCEAVRCAERAVMYALGFELRVSHPFEAMAAVVRGLDLGEGGGQPGQPAQPGTTPATVQTPVSAPGTPATAASDAQPSGAPAPAALPPRQAILQQGINLVFDTAHTELGLSHGPAALAGGVVLAVLTLVGAPRLKWRAPTPGGGGTGGGGGASQAMAGGATPASQVPALPTDGPVPWWDAPPLAGVDVEEMGAVARVLLERYAGGVVVKKDRG